ncbi:hypothetical protein PPERSA_03629 [Pseudocohnilembus persalinus]|uniref:Uncharacterized protein n=1 Tax=Pseudocohnilembus persalinus TaxID=266149 RepID=A0A0V0QDZ5_PSEPJ|nr:hypothetical protein PPERSA_03629 [Pseudocohnilembus persalinus]|eukprot:KRX00408.1 hypothetical protein PPERSA_03629 [Pseudocohnilembus persalinus]
MQTYINNFQYQNHLNNFKNKIQVDKGDQALQKNNNSIQQRKKQPKKQKKEVTDFKIYFNQKDEFDYKVFASDVENDIKLENKLKIQEEIKQHNERFNQKIEQTKSVQIRIGIV